MSTRGRNQSVGSARRWERWRRRPERVSCSQSRVEVWLKCAGQARITLRKHAIELRRENLFQAEEADDLLRSALLDMERQIHSVEWVFRS